MGLSRHNTFYSLHATVMRLGGEGDDVMIESFTFFKPQHKQNAGCGGVNISAPSFSC